MKTTMCVWTESLFRAFTAAFLLLAVIAGMLPQQAESATVTLTTAENVTAKVTLNSPAVGQTVADFFVFGDNVKKSGGTSSDIRHSVTAGKIRKTQIMTVERIFPPAE